MLGNYKMKLLTNILTNTLRNTSINNIRIIRKFGANNFNQHLIKVNIQSNDNQFFEVTGEYNDSLFDIIRKNKTQESQLLKECLECSCEGVMACSSCHIHVEEDWFKIINKPCEYEKDILNILDDRCDTSKLGCQLKLKPYLNGMNIRIPSRKYQFY